MRGLALWIAQRQHRATRKVEHLLSTLIPGSHAQHGQTGCGTALPPSVLAQCDDFGCGVERITHARKAAEHEAAIEQIRDHASGQQCRLADRYVPHQSWMGNRRAGYEAAKLSVKRQPQPVADNRSMERRESIGQCLRGRTIDDLTDLEVFEKWSTYDLMR